MTIEALNVSRPGSPTRATISALVLLVFASALAFSMTWTRARDPLVGRLVVPDLGISLRPPRGFFPGDLVNRPFGTVLPFYGLTSGRAEVVIAAIRLLETNESAAEICTSLVSAYVIGPWDDGLWVFPEPTPAQLGPFDAAELHLPQFAAVVRAANLANGTGFAVALVVSKGSIDEELFDTFDQICRSIARVDH